MELKIYNIKGEQIDKSVTLNSEIFGVPPNDHAIYLDVKNIMGNKRQGTAKTKERSDLSGSTRKLYRQKGTGRARRGDIKSPILRGGARAFGPHPRNYGFKLNKKIKQLARKSALIYKLQDQAITLIDNINFEQPKTKNFIDVLNNFKIADKKILLVLHESNNFVILSTRNLPNVKTVTASQLNTYDVLWSQRMLITEEAIKQIEENLN